MTSTTAVQQENSSRQRIVVAARTLFAERGFHQTAMADLAKEANVSVGAIYRSFASKADIILAIICADTPEMFGELKAEIEDVRRGGLPAHVAIERVVTRGASERKDAMTHEIIAEGHRNPAVGQAVRGICGQYRDLLRDLARLAQPALTDDEVEGVVELLLACLFGMSNRDFTEPRLDDCKTARVVTGLIFRLLGIERPEAA